MTDVSWDEAKAGVLERMGAAEPNRVRRRRAVIGLATPKHPGEA
jgi:hypothetical protein